MKVSFDLHELCQTQKFLCGVKKNGPEKSICRFPARNVRIKEDEILEILEIDPSEIVMANPYRQRKTERQEGCQIDYLIQTRFNTLYLCEVKFSKNKIGMKVVKEIESKMKKLKTPRNYSIRPVLIHVGGVTDELADFGCFDNIIDFGQFF